MIDEITGSLRRLRDRRRLKRWWDDHGKDIVGLGVDELARLADAITAEDRVQGRIDLARALDADAFAGWQESTIADLKGEGARRARIRRALEELSNHLADAVASILRAVAKGVIT